MIVAQSAIKSSIASVTLIRMPLALVPIPPDFLEGSRDIWFPYLAAISERSGDDVEAMEGMLTRGEAQAFIVWSPDRNKAQAFLGVRYVLSGQRRVAELIWLTGEDRKAWVHLFAELETYLREQQGCVLLKAIARRGWEGHLKASGFRQTHVVFEKALS